MQCSQLNSNLIHSTTKMQPMRQVLHIGCITKRRMAWDKMTKRGTEKRSYYCAIMFTNDWWRWWCFVNCKLATCLRYSIVFFVRVVVPCVCVLCVSVVFWLPNHMILANETLHTTNSNESYRNFGARERKRDTYTSEQNMIFLLAWTTSYLVSFSFSFSVSLLYVVLFSICFCLNFHFVSVCPRAHVNSVFLSCKWLITI